ncbi:hypothetical protein DSECCO2_372010 [anaerobic digester metagenome]
MKDTLGLKNPYRYRGYRFDTETELYYLHSRYYNPEIGRFINADDANILYFTMTGVINSNLFAYCVNNPVNKVDPTGFLSFGKQWWNKNSFVSQVIDLLIIFVPTLWSISAAIKAKLAAQKLGDIAAKQALEEVKKRSRKVVLKLVEESARKMATKGLPKLSDAIISLGGAIVNGFFTAFGTTG